MSALPAPTACLGHHGRPKLGYRPGRRLWHAVRVVGREAGVHARAYRCPSCGLWHVTSKGAWR